MLLAFKFSFCVSPSVRIGTHRPSFDQTRELLPDLFLPHMDSRAGCAAVDSRKLCTTCDKRLLQTVPLLLRYKAFVLPRMVQESPAVEHPMDTAEQGTDPLRKRAPDLRWHLDTGQRATLQSSLLNNTKLKFMENVVNELPVEIRKPWPNAQRTSTVTLYGPPGLPLATTWKPHGRDYFSSSRRSCPDGRVSFIDYHVAHVRRES